MNKCFVLGQLFFTIGSLFLINYYSSNFRKVQEIQFKFIVVCQVSYSQFLFINLFKIIRMNILKDLIGFIKIVYNYLNQFIKLNLVV